ncbi:RDD family protein [Paenibacillus planticolens]|uniref:RDD family protein n=1 Tax=Paenibacillus planticolens TaxID=2654976 RepID=A0ABX2A0M2_9BACL|nr:RDD family protein [Paenibacillus planticolens]NOV04837.1 hypothetical protein [Paenibacillus planticolens]
MVEEKERWLYKKGDHENGPFTTKEMNNLIQSGELKRITNVKRNDSVWNAAETFAELQFENTAKVGVRPWARYWARSFDMLILGFLFGILMFFIPMDFMSTGFGSIILGIAVLIVSIPYEAVLLKLWGTTVGKWIFGIKIRNLEGQRLSFSKALRRSLLVWWRGQGAGLPIISMIFNLSGYQQLKHNLGTTTWDRDTEAVVSHRPKSWWGELLVWLMAILILYFRFSAYLPQ